MEILTASIQLCGNTCILIRVHVGVSSSFALAAACNWCWTIETATAQTAIKMNTLKHIENTRRQQSTPSIAVRALTTLTTSTHYHYNAHRH